MMHLLWCIPLVAGVAVNLVGRRNRAPLPTWWRWFASRTRCRRQL